ncbi:hypothetical protein HBN50_01320 [Halobacteriovorax sp. GB3]|uniref:hypothetical protein n=1 Tax=Halobacteriovorax sp. GB3 TaxID=2719615 RepID=UPI00235DE842|nr:hypothetical protein [Halobacteriovorax sp. GB3]MDD0851708.1 hypothetical protein [Halobacteriovorax sp. GB3]
MNVAFVLFARTPGLKPIRNRLSRTTSKDFAEEFYLHSLEATRELILEMSHNNPDIKLVWAVEEKEGLKSEFWGDYPVLFQGDGGLGDKLDRVYKKLSAEFDAVFMMMPNTAQIGPEVLEFDILNFLTSDYDYLLGKTDQGGFYLFGGAKAVPFSTWINVPYNCSITFDELDQGLSKNGKVLHISESFGILERDDLENFKSVDTDGFLESQEKLHELVVSTEFKKRTLDDIVYLN